MNRLYSQAFFPGCPNFFVNPSPRGASAANGTVLSSVLSDYNGRQDPERGTAALRRQTGGPLCMIMPPSRALHLGGVFSSCPYPVGAGGSLRITSFAWNVSHVYDLFPGAGIVPSVFVLDIFYAAAARVVELHGIHVEDIVPDVRALFAVASAAALFLPGLGRGFSGRLRCELGSRLRCRFWRRLRRRLGGRLRGRFSSGLRCRFRRRLKSWFGCGFGCRLRRGCRCGHGCCGRSGCFRFVCRFQPAAPLGKGSFHRACAG